MWPYFVIPGLLALMILASPGRRVHPYAWGVLFLLTLLFVGLRHKVGMDWNNYLLMIGRVYRSPDMEAALDIAEPGYALLLRVSAELGWGVYGSNLAGTLIFCLGLFRYARTTAHPWTALLVAMPMLVTVVAMSANRQAVAIGVLLWAVAGWPSSSMLKRVLQIGFAALFHYSALLFLVFLVADLKLRRSLKLAGAGLFLAAAFYVLFVTGRADYYDSLYVTGQSEMTQSEGAIFHVLFNGGPALLYFLLSRRQRELLFPDQLHRLMAFMAIALIPMALVASAAAGRVTLYLFPVSMSVIAAFPMLFRPGASRLLVRYGTGLFLLLVLYIWLAYANSSRAHIPYGNFLTVPSHLWRLCC